MHNIALTLRAFNLLAVIALCCAIVSLVTLARPDFMPELLADHHLAALISLQYVCYLLVGLCFMHWLYTRIRAIQAAGDPTISLDPRWAYLSFGAPWLNLFLPYQIVQKLLDISPAPQHGRTGSGIHRIARVWWCLHIAYFILLPVALAFLFLTTPGGSAGRQSALALLAASLLILGISRCAHRLVLHIEKRLLSIWK